MDTEMETNDLSELVGAGDDKGATDVYEVGYHLIPNISNGSLEAEVAPLMKVLKGAGATVIGERTPLKMDLAYGIEKKVDGINRVYHEAYFGWIAFEASGSSIQEIDAAFKTNPSVLRHILIKTKKDAVAAVLADPSLDAAMVKPEEDISETPERDAETVVESVGADSE